MEDLSLIRNGNMSVLKNVSLKPFNTFGIDVQAKFFSQFTSQEELSQLLSLSEFKSVPKLILGGGSNILFTKNFEGVVLKNNIPGITVVEEDEKGWKVRAGAGINWHSLVLWCIEHDFAGIENLSLIPGNAGAAPIQNIGAYGVEVKDSFYELEAVHIETGELLKFNKDQCRFGYRDSVFKQEYKGKVVITSITLSLNRIPDFRISYGAIDQELKKMSVDELSIRAISDAVCNIRRSKLPDPVKIGNAGSFFKNPEITASVYHSLKSSFNGIVAFSLPGGNYKVAAGWLIEQCGWKGKIVGNTGSHKDQALVLVNYGKATGNEIWNLAMEIQESVKNKFGVVIEPEVNVI